MIPKIIHHSAPSDHSRWHPVWFECDKSWKRQFPETEFNHVYWTDEALENLVKTIYPQYWSIYQSFPFHIMKIDFARFCYMDRYGGINADMDIYCFRNFYDNIKDHEVSLIESVMKDEIVVSCMMAATPSNTFWGEVLELCVKSYYPYCERGNDYRDFYIKDTIGPYMVTRAFLKYDKIINFLPKSLYNADPPDKGDHIYTKHMLTGLWGKEIIDTFVDHPSEDKDSLFKEVYQRRNGIDLNNFEYE